LTVCLSGDDARAQAAGEVLQAFVLDVTADVFGCQGDGPCNLRYRMYHAQGQVEINAGPGMDGFPRFRRRGVYASDPTMTGNYPTVAGHYDFPFYVVWDGVLNPGTADHAGYYGGQSQIIRHGEQGDSSQIGCTSYQKIGACFEPLSAMSSSQVLRNGLSSIGGLAPIPVPRVRSADSNEISLDWEQAEGFVVTDSAPPAVAGYRLYAYRGRDPNQSALAGAVPVAEIPSLLETRTVISMEHPALAGAREVTFVMKMIYVANLESFYFSANSDLVELGEPEEGEEDEDPEEPPEEDAEEPSPDDGEPSDEESGAGPDGEEPAARAREAGGAEGGTGGPASSGAVPLGSVAGASGAPGEPRDPADPDADGFAGDDDNCPGLHNADQADRDGDHRGDACDPDADGDGVDDDVDCDPADPRAGRPAARVEPRLRLHGQPDELLVWPATGGTDLVYRGTRSAGEPFRYSHGCLMSGLTEGRMADREQPASAGLFYYLVAGDSRCGVVAPGAASDGTPRPPGFPCLRASAGLPLLPDGSSPQPGPWSLQALGGASDRIRVDVILEPPAGLADLYAVSLEMVHDPGVLAPERGLEPGALLADPTAPVRVDFQPLEDRPGRMRLTVSRTGVQGGVPEGVARKVLVTTYWRVLMPAQTQIRLENIQALNSGFEVLALADPVHPFFIRIE
jgi:hypothetical protein